MTSEHCYIITQQFDLFFGMQVIMSFSIMLLAIYSKEIVANKSIFLLIANPGNWVNLIIMCLSIATIIDHFKTKQQVNFLLSLRKIKLF